MTGITPPKIIKQKQGYVIASCEWAEEFQDYIPVKYYSPHMHTKAAANLVLKAMLRLDNPSFYAFGTRPAFREARNYLIEFGIPFHESNHDMIIIADTLSPIHRSHLMGIISKTRTF